METSRNTVLIIGNGFDLEMGQKTSFEDFYYSKQCPYYYPAPLILHLNHAWGDNLNDVRWFDLENELLNYYNLRQKTADYQDVIDTKELEYIKKIVNHEIPYGVYPGDYPEQFQSLLEKGIIIPVQYHMYDMPFAKDLLKSPVERDVIALDRIKNGLCDYLTHIHLQEPSRNTVAFIVFNALVNNLNRDSSFNVYSFNYTPIPWGFSSRYNRYIHHVHGNCESSYLIIGTKDDNLDKDYSFLQKSFDKHFAPPPIVDDLLKADNIIIFGHSLGSNDRQYFKPFFKAQSEFGIVERKTITIITKDDSSVLEIKRALQELTDNQLSVLMSRNNVHFIKTDMGIDDQKELLSLLRSHKVKKEDAINIIGTIVKEKQDTH